MTSVHPPIGPPETEVSQPVPWPRPVPVVGDQSSAAQRSAEPGGWALDAAARDAFYALVAARRDIRRFRPDAFDPALLDRVIAAAHAAPSVGYSQPWRFILVTEPATRERAAVIAQREALRQADGLGDAEGRHMRDLQLDGIREAPVGLVVCCDRRAPAGGVLGRATFPDADLWSCAMAVENLWLAARVEGLGCGWVTLFPPDELAALVGLPEGVVPLGWLCLGWPDERPTDPGLERAGWERRRPLAHVLLHERWEGPGPERPRSSLRAPQPSAVVGARDRADLLLTPPGSLGILDRALDRLRALGIDTPPKATLVIAAADHPVVRHGVSTYAPGVTGEVFRATVAGVSLGAAAARAAGMGVLAVDAGVDDVVLRGIPTCRALGPRGDLVDDDAMTTDDVNRFLAFGRALGEASDAPLLALGEIGIGNTTIAAALTAVLLDRAAEEVVGLGAGGDAATLDRKRAVVGAACARTRRDQRAEIDPITALGAVGGPEFAVLAGIVLGAAGRGAALVLDGLATGVAALCALRLEPGVAPHLIAGQRSRERCAPIVLAELGCEPLLDLRLRAGEGVGAVLAAGLLAAGLEAHAGTARVDPV